MAKRTLRRRFWFETGLAAFALVLGIVTAIVPDWIEVLTGEDPDGGSGAAEWAVVAGLLLVAAISATVASVELRATRRPVTD